MAASFFVRFKTPNTRYVCLVLGVFVSPVTEMNMGHSIIMRVGNHGNGNG